MASNGSYWYFIKPKTGSWFFGLQKTKLLVMIVVFVTDDHHTKQ